MRKYIILGSCIAVLLAVLPFILIAKARATRSDKTRIHLIQDMDNQPKLRAQSAYSLFADRRSMRPQVPGTIAYGKARLDTHFYQGKVGDEWATTFPDRVKVSMNLIQRGQKQFQIYCAVCHGHSGYGNGMVALRAERLDEGAWTPPLSFHSSAVLERPVGHLFNSISEGIRNMPPYKHQISVEDRWAVITYVLALQRSQNASLEDVPEEYRSVLK